ncbi:TPA: CZB domain-containing protein [Salmonella enterica subsp. diarizonae serovar 61:i:z]|nr:chemotaxis protein [Salmonella enterica]
MPDTIKRMQYIYRLQQSKLTSLSYLTDGLGCVRENLEHLCSAHRLLAGELQDSANRSRLVIRRLEHWNAKETKYADSERTPLSPVRRKSLLQQLREFHTTASSVAERIHTFSVEQRYAAELLDLSVITIKHFLWRERVFMAIILGGDDNASLKLMSAEKCHLGLWYNGRGKKAYSHLPIFRSLGEIHSRYHEMINKIIDKGVEGTEFNQLSSDLAQLEVLSQQLVGGIVRIQKHIALLHKLQTELSV